MGYGAFRAIVDPETFIPVHTTYDDDRGALLKTVTVHDQELIGNAWTVMAFTVANHQTEHRTDIEFHNMRAVPHLKTDVFEAGMLGYGVPEFE